MYEELKKKYDKGYITKATLNLRQRADGLQRNSTSRLQAKNTRHRRNTEKMVEQVITYITANWVAWLFAGAYAILIALYKKEKQQHEEEREENKAVREGLQALLRQQIIDICLKYEERKEAPAWAKQAETSAYKAYEKLGGNDVAHAMHERFMQLPLSDGNLETERIH